MTNGTWLRDVRKQERAQGTDYRKLACYASELTPYVRERLARAAHAIEMIYAHLPSPVASDETQREHWENGREAYVQRIVDVFQHLGSALAAVGCTDEEVCGSTSGKSVVKKEETPPPADFGLSEESTAEDEPDSDVTVTVKVLSDIGAAGGGNDK